MDFLVRYFDRWTRDFIEEDKILDAADEFDADEVAHEQMKLRWPRSWVRMDYDMAPIFKPGETDDN